MTRKSKDITLTVPQRAFVNAKARFPAFVGCWGSGKTLCGLLRGIGLSERYPGNLGLVVRKKFTDLRDSTLKDFERYTGLTVKKDAKEVTLANGSVIMFRHGEELSGLQNVNLGWFLIEQAEEFETAEQFDMLRGRLRREGARIRQGMVIANTAGHNWIWDRWKNRPQEGYLLSEATLDDCRGHLPADTVDDWEKMRLESPRKFNRYVLNSWEDYDLEGAYYAALMSDALGDHRVGAHNLIEPSQRVYTFWDLGVSDTTAIWCAQFIRDEIHLVDYYENSGEGMEHYAKWLEDRGYLYAEDYLPHDARNRLQGATVQTRLEILQSLRPCPVSIIQNHSIQDRIETTRGVLAKCRFDDRCAVGVEGLNHYRRRKNDVLSTEAKSVFSDTPLHDWASNPADAFGYMAIVYRYQLRIDEQLIGYPHPIRAVMQDDNVDDFNPMPGLVRKVG